MNSTITPDSKIYIQDHGVYGVIVVIANSEEEARSYMQGNYNYDPKSDLEVKDIEIGEVVVNIGDR